MKKRAMKTEQPYTEQCEICSRWFERVFSVIENQSACSHCIRGGKVKDCYGNVDREHRGDSGPSIAPIPPSESRKTKPKAFDEDAARDRLCDLFRAELRKWPEGKRATFAHWAKNLLKENGLLPIERTR